jgi:hypothetical protein
MFLTKQPKQARALKTAAEPSQERRNFLRLGALGAAVAVAAGGVLSGTPVRAAGQMRKARKSGATRTAGEVAKTETGTARTARTVGAKAKVGDKGESSAQGTRTLRKATRATQKTAKATRTAQGGTSRSATRMVSKKATARTAKVKKPA